MRKHSLFISDTKPKKPLRENISFDFGLCNLKIKIKVFVRFRFR